MIDNEESQSREKFHKKLSRICAKCGQHKNIFRVKGGHYKSDADHNLCPRCWHSLNSQVKNG